MAVISASRVMIVCPHFPPSAASGAFRMLGFVRHLPAFGWHTTIVAASENQWEPSDPALAGQIPDSARVVYVPIPEGKLAKVAERILFRLRIIDADLVWGVTALRSCCAAIRHDRPDAILTSGPPHSVHLLGAYLKRKFRIPHVADFRDPWVTCENTPGPRTGLPSRLERLVMAHADAIIMNAPRARELIESAYPRVAQKLSVITNGFDPESDSAVEAPERRGRTRIVHAGELYAGRDPRPLLQAIRALEPSLAGVGLELNFIGRTDACGTDITAEARAIGCSIPVTAEGQVPYADAKRRMREGDILLLMDSAGRRVGIPAKLFEYIGAGRPILALAEPDGDTAWALGRSGLPHVVARPNDVAAIREGLLKLISGCRARADREIPPAGIFMRKSLAGQLADVLTNVSARRDSMEARAWPEPACGSAERAQTGLL